MVAEDSHTNFMIVAHFQQVSGYVTANQNATNEINSRLYFIDSNDT